MPTAETNLQVGGDQGGAAGSGAAGGAGAQGAPSSSGSPPAKPWYDGKLTDELIGHIDNKHWNRNDPITVAIEATKAAWELQRHFGVPETHLIKLPKDQNDAEAWNGVYQRLGAPKEAKEYDFSNVKFSDGSPLGESPGFEDTMRAALYAAHVPKDKAADLIKSMVKVIDNDHQRQGAADQAHKLENLQALQKNWSHNFELNRLTALQGARRLGIDLDGLAALESAIGYPNLMEVMRKIGAGTTEDTFTEGGQVGHPTTQQGALARRAELMADQAWVTRYLQGERQARQEMDNLTLLISGEAA